MNRVRDRDRDRVRDRGRVSVFVAATLPVMLLFLALMWDASGYLRAVHRADNIANEAARAAGQALDLPLLVTGEQIVVLDAGQSGVMVHEAVGHPLDTLAALLEGEIVRAPLRTQREGRPVLEEADPYAGLGRVQGLELRPRVVLSHHATQGPSLLGQAEGAVLAGNVFQFYPVGKTTEDHFLRIAAGQTVTVKLRLTNEKLSRSVNHNFDKILEERRAEADEFYQTVIPKDLSADARNVLRQSLGGMLWSKQYYYFDLERWLREHKSHPLIESPRRDVRNTDWFHMLNSDVISMPDKWEYPWYAAWDLAFHTISLSLVDFDFAKEQLLLMLRNLYFHPSGQIPAYEWNFSDVNPPVHAWATLYLYRMERTLGRASTDRSTCAGMLVSENRPDAGLPNSNPVTCVSRMSIGSEASTWASETEPYSLVTCSDGAPLPWFTYAAIEFLAERVDRSWRVFEYGAGNGTLWWSARVREVHAVEADAGWHAALAPRLLATARIDDILMIRPQRRAVMLGATPRMRRM